MRIPLTADSQRLWSYLVVKAQVMGVQNALIDVRVESTPGHISFSKTGTELSNFLLVDSHGKTASQQMINEKAHGHYDSKKK